MSETELAQHFVDYFRDHEVYKEVPHYGNRIDIVVKVKRLLIAAEVKTSLNTTVIAQALRNRNYAHYSYVAIPYGSAKGPGMDLCRSLGLGVLAWFDEIVPRRSRFGSYDSTVSEQLAPVYGRPDSRAPLRLHDSLKKTVAGSQHSSLTQFQITVLEITGMIQQAGGKVHLSEFFERNGRFHYGSTASARHCIRQYAEAGTIPQFRYHDGWLILNQPPFTHP